MIRVIVTGAAGRMGREVIKAVTAEEGMEVVAAVDPQADGVVPEADDASVKVVADLDAALAEGADVLVDFTRADAARETLPKALAAGVHCVVGTTGIPMEEYEAMAARATERACLFVAPNFAIGAVLMMLFAEKAALHMPHAEIIELHHDKKLDAPSGTAMRTASMIAAARGGTPDAPGRETEVSAGARGALVEGVPVHSVRLPGLVAHQEVLFGGLGQTLSIRHDSIDRTSFMPGVVLAVRRVGEFSGLVVGLERLLEA